VSQKAEQKQVRANLSIYKYILSMPKIYFNWPRNNLINTGFSKEPYMKHGDIAWRIRDGNLYKG
jgi:hypothetical protein